MVRFPTPIAGPLLVLLLAGGPTSADDGPPPLACALQRVGSEEESRFLASSVASSVFRRCDPATAKSVYLHFAADDLGCGPARHDCPGRALVAYASCLGVDDFRAHWLPRGTSWRIENWRGERARGVRVELREGPGPGRRANLAFGEDDEPTLDGEPLEAVAAPLLRRLSVPGDFDAQFCGHGSPFNLRAFTIASEVSCTTGPRACGRHQRFVAIASCAPPFEHGLYELPGYYLWKARVRDIGTNDFPRPDRAKEAWRREALAAATSVVLSYSAAWPVDEPRPMHRWRWIDLDVYASPQYGSVVGARAGSPPSFGYVTPVSPPPSVHEPWLSEVPSPARPCRVAD